MREIGGRAKAFLEARGKVLEETVGELLDTLIEVGIPYLVWSLLPVSELGEKRMKARGEARKKVVGR